MKKLCIDIGNTRTKLAVFKSDRVLKREIWYKWGLAEIKAFCEKYKVTHIAMSSTAKDLGKRVMNYMSREFVFLQLSHETNIPIKNLYKTPETLGRDRLAGVIAAASLYPKENCLVIDAGTCITYDFINKKKEYYGGTIAPGIEMRFKAMDHFTAKLPLVERKKLKNFYGNDTITSMRTGGQLAASLEMDGFINLYEAKFGQIRTILTGGDANYFAIHLKTKIFVNQNLILIGLNKIIDYNAEI